jgi:hypothetical protein
MRNYSMPDKEAAKKILPKSSNDRRTIWGISGCIALLATFVVTVLFFQHRRQQEMEDTWQSATATVEDVRAVVASQVDSKYGSAMLYQVEILAHYDANGVEQHQWIRIEGLPRPRPNDSQLSRWKGQHCVVRWKASQPNRMIAELN